MSMMDSLCLGREDTTESWWWRWLASARRLSALQLEPMLARVR